ncbi:hypothetical protein, partial [Pseudomonas moraviensis]|uniref:hypothetical protein n=2 Tax=Pseudomonas TaxID=286 RepID=UPI001E33B9E6
MLAKAQCQAMMMLTVPAPSRAGILVALKIVALPRTIVGASLLAKAVCHSMWMYLIWRLREQA